MDALHKTWTRRRNDALEFAAAIELELADPSDVEPASEAGRVMYAARRADMVERAQSWRAEAARWSAKLGEVA